MNQHALLASVALVVAGIPRPGFGQTHSRTAPTAEERLDRLEQEIRILKRLRELEQDSLTALARSAPRLTAGAEGFSLRSADGRFQFRARGYFQADGRVFPNDVPGAATNSLFLRRARPILEATIHHRFDLRLMPDFGEGRATIYEAYFDLRLGPEVAVRAGKFKPPVGLERLQSATDLRFAERGLPNNLVPNRDIGLQVSGDLAGGVAAYALGMFNGVPDYGFGDGDAGDDKDVAARVFFQPFVRAAGPLQGLGVGAAASTGIERGTAAAPGLPAYRTPGQQVFFRYRADGTAPNTTVADGARRRIAPQGYFHTGPLGLLAEYTFSSQEVRRDTAALARLTHRAWQVAASWFLTGERASYRAVAPRRPFDPATGGWGAVEIAARHSVLAIDPNAFPAFANPDAAARSARAWALGVNWHLARSVKLMVDYERTSFAGGAAEHFFVTRLQTAF